jgi:hypothetical protein
MTYQFVSFNFSSRNGWAIRYRINGEEYMAYFPSAPKNTSKRELMAWVMSNSLRG